MLEAGGSGSGAAAAAKRPALPFGIAAIDALLPGGGLAAGALHEIMGAGPDEEDGAVTAAFAAGILARLARGGTGGGTVLWCLVRSDLHAPGLARLGLDPARLVVVRGRRDADVLWAMEEALREGGGGGGNGPVAAVLGEVSGLPATAGRRLQLAAETSGVTALVLRRWPTGAVAARQRGVPTAASTRWRVAALPSVPAAAGEPGVGRPLWRVELLRCRGAAAGVPASWIVEGCDASGHVALSAGLADRPARPRDRARPG
ncbi:MAG TPA: damage-inducible protein [Stellaceae bacterium]